MTRTVKRTTLPKFETIVQVVALGVAEGHYSLDEAKLPRRLEAYQTVGAAKRALLDLARSEGTAHGLVVDPWGLSTSSTSRGGEYLPEAVRLIAPADLDKPSGKRVALAHVRIRAVPQPLASGAPRVPRLVPGPTAEQGERS